MSEQAILKIANQTKARLAEHWTNCLDFDLTDHSAEAHAAVDQAIDRYFTDLASLPRPANEEKLISAIKLLFSRLDGLSSQFGSGLLETDERELIVTPVLNALAAAGLDLTRYPDGDPTLPFRNF